MKRRFVSSLVVATSLLLVFALSSLSCGSGDSASDTTNTTKDVTTTTTDTTTTLPDTTSTLPDTTSTQPDTTANTGVCPNKKGNDFTCSAACNNLYVLLPACGNQIALTAEGQALIALASGNKTLFMQSCNLACAADTGTNGYYDLWACWQKASSSNCVEAAKCNSVNCPPNK